MFMLAFFAGLIFFACAFCAKLPKNVTIDGIEVGGKSAAEAVRLVRGSIEENLKTKSRTDFMSAVGKMRIGTARNFQPESRCRLLIVCRLCYSMRSINGFYPVQTAVFKFTY